MQMTGSRRQDRETHFAHGVYYNLPFSVLTDFEPVAMIAGNPQVSNIAGHVKSGKVRAYAVTAPTREAAPPDIPTVDEAGLPGLHTAIWHGLRLPKGTPKEVVAKLNAAVVETLGDLAVRARFAELEQEIPPPEQLTPEALYAHHKAEIDKWFPIIRAAGLKAE
jgi:tripartite-type tricarboxylate transporter receptor subunit TctC